MAQPKGINMSDISPDRIWLASTRSAIYYSADAVPEWAQPATEYVKSVAAIRVLSERIAELEGLIECRECTATPDGDTAGWMPGLCPGCQAEIIAAQRG